LFFCLAFSAAALARLWPNAWTRWQRRNRRTLGVTFAASHAIHAVAIACFAMMDPTSYAAATSAASYVFGGIGYALIIAMAATSFDRTAAIGPRAWRILHLAGGYYLLFQFVVAFGKRIPDMPLYGLFLIPLLAVIALRLIAMASARTPRTVRRDSGTHHGCPRLASLTGRGHATKPCHERSRHGAFRAHAEGNSPRRLAMILSTIRFGRMAVIKCRIGSGVIE